VFAQIKVTKAIALMAEVVEFPVDFAPSTWKFRITADNLVQIASGHGSYLLIASIAIDVLGTTVGQTLAKRAFRLRWNLIIAQLDVVAEWVGRIERFEIQAVDYVDLFALCPRRSAVPIRRATDRPPYRA